MRASLFACLVGLLFADSALPQQVIPITLKTNSIVYDKVTDKLFASVPSSEGANGNSIAVINPATGSVERFVAVGSEPNVLALSDDGQFLYVGLDGMQAVRRIAVGPEGTLTPGLQFSLGTYRVQDMAVLPGSPGSVAIARRLNSSYTEGVAVYDDGVMRPTVTPGGYGSSSLAFSASASRLYGFDGYTTYRALTRMTVSPAGVTVASENASLFKGRAIRFADGLLYSSGGAIANPETLELVGLLGSGTDPDIAVDAAARRAYGLDLSKGIRAYDLDTFRPLWSVRASVGPDGRLVVTGSNRLAVKAGAGSVLIVDMANTHPLAVTLRGTGGGWVQSSPAGIACGTAPNYYTTEPTGCAVPVGVGQTVTLTPTAYSGSHFVDWSEPACAGGSVTMSMPRVCTAIFEQDNRVPTLQLPLPVNDLAYSARAGKLLATVPGRYAVDGNSLVEIDPATGELGRSVWVGSEPTRIAVSDDGRYAFVGLDGAGAVVRLDLDTFTPGTPFALGRDWTGEAFKAGTLTVLPGNSNAVAVTRQYVSGDSGGSPGLAIYDGGSARPAVAAGSYSAFVFGPTASPAYGGTSSTFRRLAITEFGASVIDESSGLTWTDSWSFADGLVFTGRQLIDPARRYPVGTVADGGTTVTIDSVGRTVYGLRRGSSGPILRAFNLDSLTPVWTLPLSTAIAAPSSLVRAGDGRLAFRTSGRLVYLLDVALGSALTVNRAGTGFGSVSSSPAGIDCGATCAVWLPADAAVTLTATPDAASRFVRWDGDSDCSDGVVTMASARSCTAVFAQLTNGLGVTLPLTANDLAYSAATGMLYASIPGSVPGVGNSIAVIDPVSGAIGPFVRVGSEPGKLAVSTDGRALFVGLNGAASVRRVDLPDAGAPVPGSQFEIDRSSNGAPETIQGLVAVPDDRDSVAVILGFGAAVHTNGVARTNRISGFVNGLAFSDSAGRLYAQKTWDLARVDYGTAGLTTVDVTTGLLTIKTGLVFDHGRLYTNEGLVVDAEARTSVGTFPVTTGSNALLVAPDVGNGFVSFVERSYSAGTLVRRYDPASFVLVDSVAVPGVPPSSTLSSLIKAGGERLAFVASGGQVFVYSRGASVTHGLVVASTNPGSGVPVTIDVADLGGQSGAATPFVRTYARGTTVTLTAPATAGANIFYTWNYGTGTTASPALTLTLNAGTTATAVYRSPAPVVTAVEPRVGPVSGGTSVTISGANFRPGAGVWFGGSRAPAVAVVDSTRLTAVTPASSASTVSISVQNDDGQYGALESAFAFKGSLTFTDNPIQPQVTTIKALHLAELRQRIGVLRLQYGLPAFGWTSAPGTFVTIQAVHLVELRTALAEVFVAAGLVPPTYSGPVIVAGQTAVTAAQINELRAAVAALW